MAWTPPSHSPYPWHDAPVADTPLDAENLTAAETGLATFAQAVGTSLATYVQGAVLVGSTAAAPAAAGQTVLVRSDGTFGVVDSMAINVQAWGAKGDFSTDDTAAVQAAQAVCQSTGKGLYFPATGNGYKLTSQFALTTGEKWYAERWSPGSSNGARLRFVFSSPLECFVASNPSANVTEGVVFEDLGISGDSTNTTKGFYMQVCRDWGVRRVWMNGMTTNCVHMYGQRTSFGQTDPTNLGDCTHNDFENCTFVLGNATSTSDCVRMGGTLVQATTITADGGTTITVANGALILGSAGTLVCMDNGEQITFVGKSGNVLTVQARGVNGTTQITHLAGAGVAVRGAMGASNMCSFKQCKFAGTTGGTNRYGLWIEAGSINTVSAASSFVGNGSDGCRISWYGNLFDGVVAENNVGYGMNFDGCFETHDNVIGQLHDGGTNFALFIDQTGGNDLHAFEHGYKLANNYFNSNTLIPNGALYALSDGMSRWRDGEGVDRPAFATHSWELPATSIPAGSVIRMRATNLTNLSPASLVIWAAEVVNSIGGPSPYTIDVYDETTGALLTTPTLGGSPTVTLSGGALADASYYAVLTALNTYGETVQSAQIGPTVVAGGGGAAKIVYTWGAITGAVNYRLYVGTATGALNVYFLTGNVTTFTLTTISGTSGKTPALDRSGNVYSFAAAYTRGNPLATIAGVGGHRLSVRLSNPSTATATLTGYIEKSFRKV